MFDRTADDLDAGTYGAGRGSLAESLRKCYVVASNDINERVLVIFERPRREGRRVRHRDAPRDVPGAADRQAQPAPRLRLHGVTLVEIDGRAMPQAQPGARQDDDPRRQGLLPPRRRAGPDAPRLARAGGPQHRGGRARFPPPLRLVEARVAPAASSSPRSQLRGRAPRVGTRKLRAYCQRQLGEVSQEPGR